MGYRGSALDLRLLKEKVMERESLTVLNIGYQYYL